MPSSHRLKLSSLAGSVLVLALCASASQAQDQGGLAGDLSYARSGGTGGFGAHSLAIAIEPAGAPLTLGFQAIQSLVDGTEVSTQVGASAGWKVSPLWSVSAQLSTTSDDLLHVNERGVAVAWNLHTLWQSKRATRLELERTVFDYSLQKGVQNVSGRIPQQRRTRLDIRQGLGDVVEVYADLEVYDYSQDPMDLARALLSRKVRRVAAAGMLGDLAERSQRLGLNWNLAESWGLDASTGWGNTVVGQDQRQRTLALSYLFHPRASASLTWSDSSADVLKAPNGLTLAPAQADSTVELGVRWSF